MKSQTAITKMKTYFKLPKKYHKVKNKQQRRNIQIQSSQKSLLDVFSDGFSPFRHSMSGQFSGKNKFDSTLNFSRGESSSLVESNQLGSFSGNSVESIMNERVHDVHSLLGDTNVRVHLLQHLVDIDGEGLHSSSSGFLVAFSFGFFLSHSDITIIIPLIPFMKFQTNIIYPLSCFQFDWIILSASIFSFQYYFLSYVCSLYCLFLWGGSKICVYFLSFFCGYIEQYIKQKKYDINISPDLQKKLIRHDAQMFIFSQSPSQLFSINFVVQNKNKQKMSSQEPTYIGQKRYLLGELLQDRGIQKVFHSPPCYTVRQFSADNVPAYIQSDVLYSQSFAHHSHVLRIFDGWEEDGWFYVLKEQCVNGIGAVVDVEECARQILTAFHQFQNLHFVHRSISSKTLCTHGGVVKVKGLGWGTILEDDEALVMGDPNPSSDFHYKPPEMLKGVLYGRKCDVWSIGVILYELIYNKKPWSSNTVEQYLTKIHTVPLEIPFQCALSPIVRQMLQEQEENRCQWRVLFKVVDIYAEDDLTEKVSMMISLSNLGRDHEALEILEEGLDGLNIIAEEEPVQTGTVEKLLFLALIVCFFY